MKCVLIKLALVYHSNRMNEIHKAKSKWWGEMAEIYGFERSTDEYVTEVVNGALCIIKKDNDPND